MASRSPHDGFSELSLAAGPQGNPFTDTPVQLAEVVFYFTEVGQQFARTLHELLKTILYRCVIQ